MKIGFARQSVEIMTKHGVSRRVMHAGLGKAQLIDNAFNGCWLVHVDFCTVALDLDFKIGTNVAFVCQLVFAAEQVNELINSLWVLQKDYTIVDISNDYDASFEE